MHLAGSVRPISPGQSRDPTQAADAHAIERGTREQRQATALDEAHRADHDDASTEHLADRRDLPADSLDELGLLASGDQQTFPRLAKQTARATHLHSAAYPLGLDHRHTPRTDRQVIDVRTRSRYASMVHQYDAVSVQQRVQAPGCPTRRFRIVHTAGNLAGGRRFRTFASMEPYSRRRVSGRIVSGGRPSRLPAAEDSIAWLSPGGEQGVSREANTVSVRTQHR